MGQANCPRAPFQMPICLLDSAVVIDTNALPLIVRAAFQCATGLLELRPVAGSEEAFIRCVSELLRSLCGCARGNQLLTTTSAYDMEMDPNVQDWVFGPMQYLTELYASDAYRAQMQEMLRERIQRVPVPEADARELLRLLNEAGFTGVGFVDATLILLGLRFAREGNTFLVTDDSDILDSIEWLQGRHEVEILGQTYSTREPIGLLLLEATRSVHACCALDSNSYRYVCSAYDIHLWERQTQGTIPMHILTSRNEAMSKIRSQIFSERAAKMGVAIEERKQRELDEITAELEHLWLRDEE